MSKRENNNKVKLIAKIAILSAISTVLMFIEFPLGFAPSFYKFDFSEVVVMLGGFALGPIPCIAIEAIKVLCNTLIEGSITYGVGEFANFLIGLSFVLPASIIYKKHKTKKHAIYGILLGTLSIFIVGMILNGVLLLPAYAFFMDLEVSAFVAMGKAVNPLIDSYFSFLFWATGLFNIFKAIVSGIIVLLVYKKISPILHI